MKKIVSKAVQFCDKCGKEDSYPYACLSCGIEMCYECRKQHGKSYNHAVYFQGGGDGFYCIACDQRLIRSGTDGHHTAYMAIQSLRDELEEWHTDFRKRQEIAKRVLKTFPLTK